MLRPFCLLAIAAFAVFQFHASQTHAQSGQLNPVNMTIEPDVGTIESTPTNDPTNTINCWISRNSTRAMATYVYTENGQLKAKFRQYNFDGESYATTNTRITNNSVVVVDSPVIAVSLASVQNPQYPELYKMVYAGNNGPLEIGYLNFTRGNKGRPASKVSVKLFTKDNGVKVSPNLGDPCNDPPVDDIGEEEMIARSPNPLFPNAPTNFVAPIAPRPN